MDGEHATKERMRSYAMAAALVAPVFWLAVTALPAAHAAESLEAQEKVDKSLGALGKPTPMAEHLPAPDFRRPPLSRQPYEQQPAAAQRDPGTTAPRGVIVPSDRRLKTTVAHIATLENGIRIYSFTYQWDDTVHVGVMAQDLLSHQDFRHAVTVMANGFYGVDYGMLNLKTTTLEAWLQGGEAAVSPEPEFSRPDL